MSHVFISYSHRDSNYVLELAQALATQGFPLWIDTHIRFGTEWFKEIEANLDNSLALIVVMSTNSKNSTWVQNEVSRAQRQGKIVFPVLLEGEVWLSLEAIQYLDARPG